ncbi:MAG: thiamine-phosphate kinase [Deltaproteobacteria bacterium]|nr:thiamine-phosphate kinase [Deltaproteobacteria bacterium]
MVRMSDLGELGLMDELTDIFHQDSGTVKQGIGDDCAIVDIGGAKDILLTTDHLVEGIHFLSGTDPFMLGRKSMAANLSDVSAMGGTALFALVNIFVPSNAEVEFVHSALAGIAQSAEEHDLVVVGGDTTASPGPIGISVTVLGQVRKGQALLRSGAKPGDLVYLTRSIGESRAGLQILSGIILNPLFPERVRDYLVRRHLDPEPECGAGNSLGETGGVSACIDISDGMGLDLSRLCKASGVGAEVLAESLPISQELSAFATATNQEQVPIAVSSGEEYALIYTTPPEQAGRVADAVSLACGRRPVCIGRITAGKTVNILLADGGKVDLKSMGHNHFKNEVERGTGPVERIRGF